MGAARCCCGYCCQARVVEMTVAPQQLKTISFVGRVHHRSGICGLFNDVHGGSNIIFAGAKYAF